MRHLNIAFYSDSYLPAVDGVVTSMLDFKRELEKRGHKVYIFASGKMSEKKKYEAKDVFLYTGLKFKPYPQYSVALFPYYSSLKLKGLGIDIIHVQTPFTMGLNGLLAAKFSDYPLIGSFHTLLNSKSLDAYYPTKNKALKKFYSKYVWRYTKFFYRSCDITIAPSETIAAMLKKQNIKRVSVVPNGINLKRFNKKISGNGIKKQLGIRDKEKVVLYVGRMSREKNVDVLLRAAKIILKKRSDIRFVFAGTGPALEGYKNLAKRLGIGSRVNFLGFVESDTLPKTYAASDLLCIPSTFETQGIVSLEAMAMGKPVVGANSMALVELIQNGKNGETFRAGDRAACARKIEKVLNNYDSYTTSTANSAKDYSSERATDKLLKTYELLLSKQAIY